MVELYLIWPLMGDAGRCADVPAGNAKNPVDVFALSLTAAGPPAASVRAFPMSVPYAVNVPELVKV